MIEVGVKSDIKELTRHLNDVQRKQIPYATARALTKTAQHVKKAEQEEIKKVFDRPTRFAINSLFVKPATKQRLTAKVWLIDYAHKGTPATKFLGPQIEGGSRRLKGFEVLLNKKGILPDGYYTVPGRRARLDRYGNISKGLLNQVLSYSGAQRDALQNTKGGRRGTKAKFIVFEPRNGLPGGIWSIHGASMQTRPVLIFVKDPGYRKRLAFFEVAGKTIDKKFRGEFEKAIAHALATAR